MKKTILLLLVYLPLFSLAQWQECASPNQGSIIELETFDGYVWAGTVDGGIYRTTNQQVFWEQKNDGLPSVFDKQCYELEVINGILYLGCRGGLYKKTSANVAWVQLLDFYNPINALAGNSSALLAGLYGGLRRSTDGGQTWTTSNSGLPAGSNYNINLIDYNPVNDEFLLYIDFYGMYKSINQGQSWLPISYPTGTSVSSSVPTMLKTVNNTTYLGLEPVGLFSWNSINSTWQDIGSTGARITDMVKANNNYIVTSSNGIQNIGMGGGNFQFVFGNSPSYYPGSLSLEKSGDRIYIGGMSECAKTIDTLLLAFTDKSEGMKAAPIEFLSGNGTALLTHGHRQHFTWRSTDEFSTAQLAPTSYLQLDEFTSDYSNGNNWYVISSSQGVQYSNNAGQSFRQANTGLPPSGFLTYDANSICNTNAGYLIIGTRNGQFYKSTSDTSWVLLSDLLSTNEVIDKIINVGPYLFAGTQNFNASFSHLYRSVNNGLTWQILAGPFQIGRSVYGLEYDGTRLVAGSSGYGTFVSYDFGVTWITINDGLPLYSVITKMKSFNGEIFAVASGYNQLFRLQPGDTTWFPVNSNVGDPIAYDVYFQNGTLYMGTPGNGIWKFENYLTGLNELTTINTSLYPNPSRSCILEISNDYTLPLVLSINDIQGKVVQTIRISYKRNQVYLDATDFARGIYFISLTDNSGKIGSRKWIVE
jgi:Secretion system C-terminal sorting domain